MQKNRKVNCSLNLNEKNILPHVTTAFKTANMKKVYPDSIDYLPPIMPQQFGPNVVHLQCAKGH